MKVLKDNIIVSVIMPTYNTPEEYLKKAIESILNQSYSNLEFIIICDGSVNDEKIIEKYKDSRIKIIKHAKNEGIAKSLNEAMNIAKGKYIARMDSDDISLKNRIKQQVKYMEENNDIVVCGMNARCIGKSNKIKSTYNRKSEEIGVQLLYMNCVIHPTVMLRKSFLDKNKIKYNEKFTCSQDYELWTRIITNNNFAIISKVGLLHRVHSKQISQKKGNIQKRLREEIINENAKKIKTKKIEDARNLLLGLSGDIQIDMSNYKELIKLADSVIKEQDKYTMNLYKKVFYNRIFQLIMTTKELRKNIIRILKENKELINFNNFKYIVYKIVNLIEEKIRYIL